VSQIVICKLDIQRHSDRAQSNHTERGSNPFRAILCNKHDAIAALETSVL
jgi:hypothetical protein